MTRPTGTSTRALLDRLKHFRGWAALLVAIVIVMMACGGSGTVQTTTNNAGGAPTATDSGSGGSGSSPSTTPGSGSGSSSTATPGSGGGSPPPAATATPVPFSVSSASAAVSAPSYTGACSSTYSVNFSARINVPASTTGGTVSYHWVRSDSSSGPTQTVHFKAGDTWHSAAPDSWNLSYIWGSGSSFWEALVVTAPNGATSNHATFSFNCQSKITGIHAIVSPGSYSCGSSSVTFNYTATISVGYKTSSYTVNYSWLRSDGPDTGTSVSVPAGVGSVNVTTSWTLYSGVPNGTYWEQVLATSPNGVNSNKASFTVSC